MITALDMWHVTQASRKGTHQPIDLHTQHVEEIKGDAQNGNTCSRLYMSDHDPVEFMASIDRLVQNRFSAMEFIHPKGGKYYLISWDMENAQSNAIPTHLNSEQWGKLPGLVSYSPRNSHSVFLVKRSQVAAFKTAFTAMFGQPDESIFIDECDDDDVNHND